MSHPLTHPMASLNVLYSIEIILILHSMGLRGSIETRLLLVFISTYVTQNGMDEMKGGEELMDYLRTHGCIQPGLTNNHWLSRYTLFPSWRNRRALITRALWDHTSSLSGKYSFIFHSPSPPHRMHRNRKFTKGRRCLCNLFACSHCGV